ncbi:MAG: DUF5665 domain-containing protein [Candidatus Pacebacteria bacterium]|nr:DUF5665 domain-containing protein [Candidatus Paceibacterota bacterium]MDR3583362.1 DUF5665 domain-containing protein [Candidatus Paceibacterota bacterium]
MSKKNIPEENNLVESIQGLIKEIKYYNSYWQNLVRGVLFGIGSAIGASIIAAIVVGFLARAIHTLKDVPGLLK